MRAYQLIDGNDVKALAITERPAPQAGAGQVVIDVKACSLNYRDLLVVKGSYASSGRASGVVPLSDGAGVISAVGAGLPAINASQIAVEPSTTTSGLSSSSPTALAISSETRVR